VRRAILKCYLKEYERAFFAPDRRQRQNIVNTLATIHGGEFLAYLSDSYLIKKHITSSGWLVMLVIGFKVLTEVVMNVAIF
jgi:uncharacterized Rmd1/YagE family protein